MSGAAALSVLAPAKLNLRLDVGPPGADGYHPLRSLFVALSGLADHLRVAPAARREVICPLVPERENLVWRALDALEDHVGRRLPVRVTIDKRIPAKAGLGGGSSDAAATLRAARSLFDLALGDGELEAVAARVGSDVPFFIRAGAQWATGRGERLRPTRVPPFAAVLALDDEALATPAVYRRFDPLGVPAPGAATGAPPPPLPAPAAWVGNDLWPAAHALAPSLGRTARALRAAGARAVVLCGSGACLAGITATFEEAQAVMARLPPGSLRCVVGPTRAARGG